MNQYYVYILCCSDGSYYVGRTTDIERRLSEHNAGGYSDYTSKLRPVELVFVESCSSEHDAYTMEHTIKKWSRKKKEILIA